MVCQRPIALEIIRADLILAELLQHFVIEDGCLF